MKTLKLFSVFFIYLFFNQLNAQKWINNQDKSSGNYYNICNAFQNYWGNRLYERGKGYKQFMRWEYDMRSKSFPDGNFPKTLRFIEERKKFDSENKAIKQTFEEWFPLGISSWVNGASGYNPGNGRINSVTVDPNDPNTLFIAAPSGGVWKSTDLGLTWNTTFDQIEVIGTSTVAINPQNSDEIYVGTGDRDGWDVESIGVLKSDDGGATWQTTGISYSPVSNNINKIIYNPLNPKTIFVSTDSRIYRSRNGGLTWNTVYLGSYVSDLKFNPADTNIIYGCGDKFIRSINAGNNFQTITSGLPTNAYRVEIAVTQANPSLVYLLACNDSDYGFGGLYKSSDNGSSFVLQSDSPNIMGYEWDGSDVGGQGWYDIAITASPTDENLIFTGGVNVWKSYDGGQNWQSCTAWYYYDGAPYTHADIHYLNFYGDRLFVCSDGGVFYSDDEGNSWNNISSGLEITQFYRMGIYRGTSLQLAAGAQDNGCNLLKNGNWTHLYGADGMECIIAPNNSNVIYVCFQNGGIQKSTNGGSSFSTVSPDSDGDWVTPYIMKPDNASILFAAYKKIYKSTNAGSSWSAVSDELAGGENLNCLTISPTNTNYIYTSYHETLYYTSDGGTTWNTSVPSSNVYITGISVEKNNPMNVWMCGTSGSYDKVMFSQDGGATFASIYKNLTNMGFQCITSADNDKLGVYMGTEKGIFYTDTTLQEWVSYNNGLPHVKVSEIEINPVLGKIYVATYGRGIWEADIYDNTVGTENLKSNASVEVFPNPATENIRIDIPGSEKYLVKIFNAAGKNIMSIDSYHNQDEIPMKNLCPGTYYISINSETGNYIKKISVVK